MQGTRHTITNPASSIEKPAETRKISLKTPLKFSGSKNRPAR